MYPLKYIYKLNNLVGERKTYTKAKQQTGSEIELSGMDLDQA